MKKLVVIVLVVLLTIVSLAANNVPGPGPLTVKGTLRYGRNNICSISDYIALPVMDNLYLTGKGFPTQGQYNGCQIRANGYLVAAKPCRIFMVTDSSLMCSGTVIQTSASLKKP